MPWPFAGLERHPFRSWCVWSATWLWFTQSPPWSSEGRGAWESEMSSCTVFGCFLSQQFRSFPLMLLIVKFVRCLWRSPLSSRPAAVFVSFVLLLAPGRVSRIQGGRRLTIQSEWLSTPSWPYWHHSSWRFGVMRCGIVLVQTLNKKIVLL